MLPLGRRLILLAGFVLGLTAAAGLALAETVTVAVAANFAKPLAALERAFETETHHELESRVGSTGQTYAQILNGAPFDVFLAADQERPRLLVEQGLADAASRFTYAEGRLALWTQDPKFIESLDLHLLAGNEFRWLAIASPELAPYGAAAKETLIALGLWETLQHRIVRGQSIAAAFAMAATGNAEFAFVALSQALAYEEPGAYVVVPDSLYAPIRQDVVLIRHAKDNAAAVAFVRYLGSAEARMIIERFGYRAPDTR
jgi:molybdate transport system substrate-binding protein